MADVRYSTSRGFGTAFMAGVFGALVMTILGAIVRSLAWSDMNLEMMLGSMVTQRFTGNTWLIGFGWHLLNGGVFALFYAAAFRSLGRSSARIGMFYGFVHWAIVGIAMGFLPLLHPMMPGQVPSPGFFVLNTGPFNFFAVIALHLIYGSIVGGIYNQRASKTLRLRTVESSEVKKAA